MHLTQQQLAEAFGVSQRTIQRWHRDGLEEARTGPAATYDLASAIAWRLEVVAAESDDELRAARTRMALARAERAELELRHARGEFIARSDVGELLRRALRPIADELNRMHIRWADELAKRGKMNKSEAKRLLREVAELVKGDLRDLPSRNGRA